ncbi:uncharacterized protein [Venturia canescens]|uniref:uncharacterized protein n=1 Tax=Venturia canescens TaxID=32260 RepID=UPI001C9C4E0B|nr:uncharacterized protein LOC122415610 [Venturia canescens]
MNRCTILMVGLVLCCTVFRAATAENNQGSFGARAEAPSPLEATEAASSLGEEHTRPKRTLFLKKKLLGAGLLGFGLGIAKGYKAGYYHGGPEVHHVYVAPPPPPAVKYVEYVEKPVFVERIVERPVFKSHPVPEFDPAWSHQAEPSPVYGPSW